ncbi:MULTISPECIES: glycine C-acetyltransferase [unclassified Brevundimonas]|uniref:glycine C-acetyltransferase n=1 Tax=unclassified Brevundimonas TaxID=2622653 RepID=UPI000CFCFFB6|nr:MULTISPECIES: glycine C-acetyltransferase [unclassified Brevundimonas]PRA28965.1 glycine C-acetyltransferase [Brevundimonas sp. MYb27]PQZ84710.1 glycine C-acetyltransferase [Brevundimonas sp. MYb31]PRB12483.1 glycine C-acetyltransferase [Brevundimonas sp. MYb52]PRB32946.1 glycine C-acetyltransferase [Brevundimonas sp. MYb46]PRB50330.1 glycine C-acetyltransferase [Brevundimonas sp. MYb33]
MTQITNTAFYDRISAELTDIDAQGLTKPERVIASRQGPVISVNGRDVLNFCANNYLGLAGDERVTQAGIKAMQKWGAGTASVRFICGTLEIHKELERAIADYLGFEDTILFAAAFDANGGIFEPLFGAEDAIVSDSLNHASIIDGVRLCKAKRYRFATSDMADLEAQLKQARADGAREIIIATDGAFSMDGYIAKLKDIRALADQYGALIMVDDCHATGFLGEKGRGSYAWNEVEVDFVTGTFGKALGGAMGGFICAKANVVALLKQRARPYLFSNALAPAVCGSSLEAIRIAAGEEGDALRAQLFANAARFRSAMTAAGFTLQPGEHPIIPVMLGDAKLAQDMAARMLELGVYVIGFSFPVVPRGQARIRTQMSAAHTFEQIDAAVAAFTQAGKELGVI